MSAAIEAPLPEIVEPAPPTEIAVAAAPVSAIAAPLEVAAAIPAEIAPASTPSPDPMTVEIAESFRTLVARGVSETRARFEAARIAGEQAFAAVEASCGAAQSGMSAMQLRAIEALQAGADAQFGLLKSLASAKSLSEMVTLHTEYARRQYEETASRAKDIAELARKVAEDSSAPLRDHVAQSFRIAV